MFDTPSRPVRWAAVLLLPSLLATGCFVDDTATLSVDRVVGTWTSADGATLSFAADLTFTSTGLASKKLADYDERCPAGRAAGTWQFFADDGDGDSSTSQKAVSGSEVGLFFDDLPQSDCSIDLTAVKAAKGRTALCVTLDPDEPCGPGVRFTRRT
ncbi:hypothetical protein ACH41H_09320 [Streptomyces sp. NPDC020800]|uniref:hypothetical protein n=1 Tax=Streptomyces sp. NPDC020800 TaxID=3365092 RepID=UPI0037A612FC